jgi:hypothetical protein
MMPAAECPWSRFDPPTMKFCEENLCAWVTQPANAWSNLAYVLVGLYVWRSRQGGAGAARLFGPLALAVGLTSFAYHASFTFVFQVADLGSMFLLSSLLVVLNLRRAGVTDTRRLVFVYIVINAVSLALLVALRKVGILLFGLQLLAALVLEVQLRRGGRARTERFRQDRDLALALGSFAVSYVFWALDFFRLACDPSQHVFQGHAAWHVINSSCFLLLSRYYRGIESGPAFAAVPAPAR